MHSPPQWANGFALGLAALGLAALSPTAARAQTQDMFVSDGNTSTISRFAGTGPGTFSTTATVLAGGGNYTNTVAGLAFDASGDLFSAATGVNAITEYAAGATPGSLNSPAFVETAGLSYPAGLATNARGDLFVANVFSNSITRFAAGATSGTLGTATTLTGAGTVVALAVDSGGDLFAVDFEGAKGITEFAFNAVTDTYGAGKNVADGQGSMQGLAVDANGDIFASDYTNGTITEFSPLAGGTYGAGKKFATNLSFLVGLAFDAHGDLFAAGRNSSTSTTSGIITEFAFDPTAGTLGTGKTIESGLFGPGFIAFGPSASAPVPEASTTVSLGLLLVLGMGGVVVARKRRKA